MTAASSVEISYAELLEATLSAVEAHAASTPYEAVGILSSAGTITPLINQRRSISEFMVSARLVGEGIDTIRAAGNVPVALYHTHPTSSADPSLRDLEMMRQAPLTLFAIMGRDRFALFVWDDETDRLATVAEVARV